MRYRVFRYQVRKAQRSANEPELRLLSAFAGRGTFVDIGANIGAWSIKAAGLFTQVYAYEPDENVSALLQATAPANVQVHSVALSNRSGTAQLAVPVLDGKELATRASLERGANPGFTEIRRDVMLATLDSQQLHDIAVIKIDVEGHEAFVLDGAAETIARERPVLIVEIEERHHRGRSREVFDRLLDRGYACRFVRDNRLHPFDISMIEELQPVEMEPEFGFKHAGYVNNFIFVPEERSQLLRPMADALAG
jgi:FkbM family methyltransferase